jgi:hypothetical protein
MTPEKVAVVVTGSRFWTDVESIRRALEALPPHSIVIHGGSRGADTIAARIARSLGHDIEKFPASWALGPKAGPLRNARMINRLDELRADGYRCFVLAFPHPTSTGTPDCMSKARRAGFRVLNHAEPEERQEP